MKNLTLAALLTLLTSNLPASAEIKNFETEGNLESTASLEVMETEGISSKNTPADLFRLVEKKVKNKDYDSAAITVIVAMSYGQYDTRRVEDKTAHQAIAILRMNTFSNLDPQEIEAFQTVLHKVVSKREFITETLKKLGPPDYYPTYMIQHGMGAFTGNKTPDGLVPDFNGSAVWEDIIAQFKNS